MKIDHKPLLSLLTPDQRKVAIEKIIDSFATERDEVIGIIAAEDLLDMFLDTVGTDLFNRGVKDVKDLVNSRFQELDFQIELLLRDKN